MYRVPPVCLDLLDDLHQEASMKYTILYAHPNPKSFNHAVLERVEGVLKARGREYVVRDLYAMQFEPRLTSNDFVLMQQGKLDPVVAAEQSTIRQSDGIIVIHPVWWFSMPAILKGYIDRVFSRGFAYDYGPDGVKGLLPGKKVLIVNTTGGSAEDYQKYGFKEALCRSIDAGIFGLSGMEVVRHEFLYGVPVVSDEERRQMLSVIDTIEF